MGKVYYEVGYQYKKFLRWKEKKWYTEEQILEMEKYFEEKEITN